LEAVDRNWQEKGNTLGNERNREFRRVPPKTNWGDGRASLKCEAEEKRGKCQVLQGFFSVASRGGNQEILGKEKKRRSLGKRKRRFKATGTVDKGGERSLRAISYGSKHENAWKK